ncbi:MAG: metallophosphoesterase [Candidatus Nanohalobium sp.]
MKVGIVTDIHYGDKNSYEGMKYNKPSEGLDRLKKVLENLVDDLDFLLFLGDQIDAVNEERDRRRLKEVKEYVNQLDVNSKFLVGNHEIKNLNKEEVLQILNEEKYGTLRRDGTQFIFLDTLHEGYNVRLGEEQVKWLEEKIDEFEGETILFSHAPLYNFDSSNNRWLEGRQEKARIRDYETFSNVLEKLDGKVVSISGHVHQNSVKITQEAVYITLQSFTENISLQNDGNPCESHSILSTNQHNLKIFEQNSVHKIEW